jgi:large subunit ribosomal protein L14
MAIQKLTKLRVADNSGALMIQCFHIMGSTGKVIGEIGDIIVATVKKAVPGGAKIKKGTVVRAVIVRTVKHYRRADGSYISFGDNAAVILKSVEDKDIEGTRIFGPVPRELYSRGFNKILSLASAGVV